MVEGFGIGLRREFAAELATTSRDVDWVEVVPEQWLGRGGMSRRTLDQIIERWPIVPHSISLSIGGTDALDDRFISETTALCRRAAAPYWSDHICFATAGGAVTHSLLPLPCNAETVDHVIGRIRALQARVDVPLVFENPTYYVRMPDSDMTELAFLSEVFARSGAGMLLDVNNVYVNAQNHGFDARTYIEALPLDQVVQIHLAGHRVLPECILDTHEGPVPEPVWELYRLAINRAGRLIPTLVEWDSAIPALDVVLDEVDRARREAGSALDQTRRPEAA